MKKERVLNAIVGKLISEGVLAENYNTNEALMVLSHCVMPIKLQTYLVNCEEEVKVRLEKLSQIKQINATENPEFCRELSNNLRQTRQKTTSIRRSRRG